MTASHPGEGLDLSALGRVHLFPVRHHSPRSSAVLTALLAEARPKVVLIEAPRDATSLADVLTDPATRPPVAILGYRTDGTPGSSLWPFAAYSPEYVAARWAKENGARVGFIDIPVGVTLAGHAHAEHDGEGDEPDPDKDIEEADEVDEEEPPARRIDGMADVHRACAESRGYRSFEEFWEASFEAPKHDVASFRAALIAYADLVRHASKVTRHRARDAFMARMILEEVARGVAPESIAVVTGAAHTAAFVAADIDFTLEETLPAPVPTAVTLIPFSFPRLAEQTGYGAGNRAPQYYQRAHDAGMSFKRATLEVLVEFTEHLRLRGFMASLADTIEAYRLAVMLADIRGKAEPGLDEVREATIATLCRGEAAHVDGFLWPSVVGRHVGRVADRIGKNSLQEEFWREVEGRKLPSSDAPESFTLKLNDPVQVETSVFLHRLRVAAIPYAGFLGKQVGGKKTKAKEPVEGAGEVEALTRLSEAWEAQWTPSTDVALVEKIVLGDNLEQVASRALEQRLEGSKGAGEAAMVLLEAVVTSCPAMVSSALSACDRSAATDDDLPSLARSASVLSSLVAYGSSRKLSSFGDDAIPALCKKTFARAVLRVEVACTGTDEAVEPAKKALRTLHEVALAQPLADKAAWLSAAQDLVKSYAVNPSTSGLATGLLYLAQELDDDDITLLVGQRLSDTLEPARAASFLAGFFEVNALALVKARPVVAALDAFLVGIEKERFKDALPVLRRAFSPLGATERRYLLENVLAVREIGKKAKAASAVLLEKDKEKLKAMSTDLSQAMDDLDDLL